MGLLFQPAEESSFGARRVLEAGRLQRLGLSSLFGLHVFAGFPSGTAAVGEGAMSANVDRFVVRVRGRGGHAAHPDQVLDPIVAGARLVGSLQEIASRATDPFSPVVVSVTRLTGGTTWNVIPDEVELEGTARTFSAELRDEVERQVRARTGALAALGYETEVDWRRSCPSVVNDPALVGLYRAAATDAGFELVPAVRGMGGEDFAEYAAIVPTCFANVGIGCPWPGHSPHFKVDPGVLGRAARLYSNVAVRALARG